jgi:hypothetical protein
MILRHYLQTVSLLCLCISDSDNLYLSDNSDVDTNTMGADMVNTDAIETTDANLADTNLADTDMMDTDATDTDATGAMTDTHATDADLTDVDMTDADAMDNTRTHTTEDDLPDAGAVDVDATASAIVVIRFSFGRPGAPIIGPHQTSASNGSSSMATGDSVWSPFCSQLDWEVARWAKTCGATSSAVTDLLSIPGVGTPRSLLSVVALIHRFRLLASLGFHTGPQNN